MAELFGENVNITFDDRVMQFSGGSIMFKTRLIEGKFPKDELEKIILIKVPTEIYPEIRNIIVFLFEKSGFKKINIDENIDFLKVRHLQ